MWPAELPSGARWLPYSVEPTRFQPPIRPAASPPATFPAKRGSVPMNYWRLVLAAVIGAGLLGIGGGMAAAAIFGAR